MKKQHLTIVLLLNLSILTSTKAQELVPEFDNLKKIEELSSSNEESMPFPYSDGKKIYFVRTVIKGSMKQRVTGQDIWESDFDGSSWSEPTNSFDEVNDNGNNGVIGVSYDGNTVYLFNSVQTRRKLARGIAVTRKDTGGNWSDLKKVEIPGFEVGQGLYSFYMTPNEKTLLIGMYPSDTSYQSDLFVSLKNTEGNWGELINMGETINTSGIEITPFIDEKGTTLYFSSDGHKGLGGMDIFKANRLDDTWSNWSTPVNLNTPINSDAFDAYFMCSPKGEAIFTSSRGGQFSDIYSAKIKKEEVKLKEVDVYVQIYHKKIPVVNFDIFIKNDSGNVVDMFTTDKNGKFSFMNKENKVFKIQLDAKVSALQEDVLIYLTDESGNKLKRLNLDKNGVFTAKQSLFETKVVESRFEYKSLPQANTTLVIIDKNGFPIDTTMTDEDGNFYHKRLKIDDDYSIRPLMNSTDFLAKNMEFFPINPNGKKLASLTVVTEKKVDAIDDFIEPNNTVKNLEDNSDLNEAEMKILESKTSFGFNSFSLDEASKDQLNEIVQILKNNPTIKIVVEGHTCNMGTDEVNEIVGKKRALSVKQYLIKEGVNSDQLTVESLRDKQPLVPNISIKNRVINRRVELRIMKK